MQSGTAADYGTRETDDLDSRYGEVGILAVAAALPYRSDSRNSAYARVDAEIEERFLNAQG